MLKHMEKCYQCGEPVSYETGFTITGTLAEGSQDRIYCPGCAPALKGYTLSDLQRIKADAQTEHAKHEMSLLERVGPDVYFHVTS